MGQLVNHTSFQFNGTVVEILSLVAMCSSFQDISASGQAVAPANSSHHPDARVLRKILRVR
jgi:hypothetical protein